MPCVQKNISCKNNNEKNPGIDILLQAFGVPTILTHVGDKPEFFFGSDRFHLIAEKISETWMGPDPDAVHAKF